jgi:hypothetical protein
VDFRCWGVRIDVENHRWRLEWVSAVRTATEWQSSILVPWHNSRVGSPESGVPSRESIGYLGIAAIQSLYLGGDLGISLGSPEVSHPKRAGLTPNPIEMVKSGSTGRD